MGLRISTNVAAIKARMKNQWSQAKKVKMADYVIHNIDKQSLEDQIRKMHKIIIAKK